MDAPPASAGKRKASKGGSSKKKKSKSSAEPAPATAPLSAQPGKNWYRVKNIRDDTPECRCLISKIYTSDHLLPLLSHSRLSISGSKGYRLSRATHAVGAGMWYYEVAIELNAGHVRVGWAQGQTDRDLPCGCEMWSYSYRSREGTAFNNARGKPYGEQFKTGDVIGCLISFTERGDLASNNTKQLPGAGRCGRVKQEANKAQSSQSSQSCSERSTPEFHVVTFPPSLIPYYAVPQRKPDEAVTHNGSYIKFFKNGVDQGVAFENIWEGDYFPAVSLFKNARVTYNFGPDFRYPPAADVAARAMSELGVPPAEERDARVATWVKYVESNQLPIAAEPDRGVDPAAVETVNQINAGGDEQDDGIEQLAGAARETLPQTTTQIHSTCTAPVVQGSTEAVSNLDGSTTQAALPLEKVASSTLPTLVETVPRSSAAIGTAPITSVVPSVASGEDSSLLPTDNLTPVEMSTVVQVDAACDSKAGREHLADESRDAPS